MKKKVKCANCGKEFKWEYIDDFDDSATAIYCSAECANECWAI